MCSRTILVFYILIHYSSCLITIDNRTITEKQGRDVILTCRFDNLNENDHVMWNKNEHILSIRNDISGDRKKYEILNKYDLIIKNVDYQDNGHYVCQNFEQQLCRTVDLTILTKPNQPKIEQISQHLIEELQGDFVCSTYGGYPAPNFQWFINQQSINQTFYRNSMTNNRSTSELSIRLDKSLHNSSLICQIDNQALEKPLTTVYQLNILYKPQVNLYENQTKISNLNYLVNENEYLIINCQIDSNPQINHPITWLKDSVSLMETSSSLILRNLQRIDNGEYTCLGRNHIGYGQSSIFIRVQYSPIVYIQGGGLVNENERVVLTCQVDSYPPVDYYQWYKNNDRLNVSSTTAKLIFEKISKFDQGTYICMVKNTLKYSNGSSIERFNKSQSQIIVQYAPKLSTQAPIVAEDLHGKNVTLSCQIDSYPSSVISWLYQNRILFNSPKYKIIQNASSSYLILNEIQSSNDYGIYSCNASNKFGYNSTTIQLRSKGLPETPMDFNVTNVSYSKIGLKWKQGFHGGSKQTFLITINNLITKETDQDSLQLTNLEHLKSYNISIRALNQLGQSENYTSIIVQTKDVPINNQDLSIIDKCYLNLRDRALEYRLDNETFHLIKVPLCIRINLSNETSLCEKIVTSTGIIQLNQSAIDSISNVSICLDEYEEFCGETYPIEIKSLRTFDWMLIMILSIICFAFLLFVVGAICLICKCRRRRRENTHQQRDNFMILTSSKTTTEQPVIIEPVLSNSTNPKKLFSNVTYPESNIEPSIYTKLPELERFNQVDQRKHSMHSSDPILSSSSLSICDPFERQSMSIEKDLNLSQAQYIGYSYSVKDDQDESGYSTPMKHSSLNKKTVYEVVV